jgi:hypothetical protein
MSMIFCQGCDCLIDSDDDPECFVPDPRQSLKPYPDLVLCESCRERREMEAEESDPPIPPDWQPTPAHQAIMDAAQDEDGT